MRTFIAVCALVIFSASSVQGALIQSKPEHGVDQSITAPSQKKGNRDIVVVGTPDGPFPVTVDAHDYTDLRIAGEEAAENAHFFSRCVKPIDNGSLHELIDGQPHREIRAAALNRIVRGYMACYPGYGAAITRDYGTCNAKPTLDPKIEICRAFYDRGALVEKVLQTYAPDLSFSTQQVVVPSVLARFRARESQFDRTRSKGEAVYAEVAGCLVARHPQLSLALLKSDLSSSSESHLRSVLLGTSPGCLGGAKRVTVDPAQFRVFIADAVYSWTIALKGVSSLIPYNKKSSFLP